MNRFPSITANCRLDFTFMIVSSEKNKRMQLVCLQLNASCLQESFSAYNYFVGTFSMLATGALVLTTVAFVLAIETVCFQWEIVQTEHLNGL